MARRTVTVSIAVEDLVHIATHGELGTGKLGDLMKVWAQRECVNAGLSSELKKSQEAKMKQLRVSLANVLGVDIVRGIEIECEKAAKKLQED